MADTAPITEADVTPPVQKGWLGFPGVFWIANWMELVERFAYYGLRTVVPIYMVLAYEEGGPQFSHEQKGTIFMIWALVQSFVPIFTGGFADRYGYKLNIAISTVIKIAGYMVMGWAIDLGGMINGETVAAVGGAAGGSYTYPIFFAGAMMLATGTAIFKPGVQGIIGVSMPASKASFGWGIFYQCVNIGGFIGPLFAAVLTDMSWKWVFGMCAIGIALNFIPLFFFAEPKRKEGEGFHGQNPFEVFWRSIFGILRPRVAFFTLLFAGFWLMFYQLFDILPNFIDDWVDSRGVVQALDTVLPLNWIPTVNDGNLNQAWMINFNALLISLFAFAMGWVTGKFKSLPAMILGIGVSVVSIYMLGMSMSGWFALLAIGVFSIGEMTASPTKLRYMASIAPPGKKGLFLGYANATVGIGWAIGSWVAGHWYEKEGDKVNLAKRHLIEVLGTPAGQVEALQKTDVLPALQTSLGLDADATRQLLWDTYEPYAMWGRFALIGFGSMIGLLVYDQVCRRYDAKHGLNIGNETDG
ncbi:MAG TPA: MFS transporter [Planctomycetota bacterium]